MSAHTNPHSCKSKFWRPWRKIGCYFAKVLGFDQFCLFFCTPWQKISCSFASLGDFGAIQAQAVAKIFILMRKSIPLERVWAKSRTSGFSAGKHLKQQRPPARRAFRDRTPRSGRAVTAERVYSHTSTSKSATSSKTRNPRSPRRPHRPRWLAYWIFGRKNNAK